MMDPMRCIKVTGSKGVINRVVSGFAGFLAYTFKDFPVYIPDSLTKAVYDKSYGYQFNRHEKWGDNASYMDTKCILVQIDSFSGNQDDNSQVGFGEWVDEETGEALAGAFMRFSGTITVTLKFRFASKNDAYEFIEELLYFADSDLIWSVLVNGVEVPARLSLNEQYSFSTNDDNKYYIELNGEIETQIPVFGQKTQDASKLIMGGHWQGFGGGDVVNMTTDNIKNEPEIQEIKQELDEPSYNRHMSMNEWLNKPRTRDR